MWHVKAWGTDIKHMSSVGDKFNKCVKGDWTIFNTLFWRSICKLLPHFTSSWEKKLAPNRLLVLPCYCYFDCEWLLLIYIWVHFLITTLFSLSSYFLYFLQPPGAAWTETEHEDREQHAKALTLYNKPPNLVSPTHPSPLLYPSTLFVSTCLHSANEWCQMLSILNKQYKISLVAPDFWTHLMVTLYSFEPQVVCHVARSPSVVSM